jgi:hypothetical protein
MGMILTPAMMVGAVLAQGAFDPRLEPVALPALRANQNHPGRLHEQDAQIAIAALRYLAEDGAVSGRDLPGHQPKPDSEVATLGEHIAGADCRHRCAGHP